MLNFQNSKKEDLQEFQKIYKSIFWTDITEMEASIQGTALINIIKITIPNYNFDYAD